MHYAIFLMLLQSTMPATQSYAEIRNAIPITEVAIELSPVDPTQVVPYERNVRMVTIRTSLTMPESHHPLDVRRWKADWVYVDLELLTAEFQGLRLVFHRSGSGVYLQVFDWWTLDFYYVKLRITEHCPETKRCTVKAR